MRLKRLELHGFKTFAGQATLEFAPGITAVVGPNGSGKSNLAEAVRWALGEQSLKLLRGRKAEDVIFAGGGGRAPLGMAEVTLTLDNADGALGTDFSEVAISRRAYRSGDNEYYLNRCRVRLRDVAYLLARAGIGQNGYSVIGQGAVDLALALRPEERRGLFEDAADVRRYLVKRAEADAKLAEVRTNATRVADLIADLEPRVAQLQRQARRAGDEARLRAEWRAAAGAWMAHQRWELEQALGAWEPEASRLASVGEQARQAAAGADTAAARAKELQAEQRTELARLEAERSALREAVDAAGRDVAILTERRRAAQRAAAEASAHLERVAARQAAAEAAVPEAECAARGAAADLEAARRAFAAAQEAVRAREQGGSADEDGLRQARAEAVAAARALTQATTQVREAQRQQALLGKQAAEAAAGRSRAEEALAAVTGRLAALDQAAARRGAARGEVETARERAAGAGAAAQQRVEDLQATVGRLDRQIEALEVRLAVLREVAQDAVASGAGGEGGEEEPAAGRRTLAQLLHVADDLEAALAAALGPALEWVVVDTPDEAAALALAHARDGGRRTTFIARADDRRGTSSPGSGAKGQEASPALALPAPSAGAEPAPSAARGQARSGAEEGAATNAALPVLSRAEGSAAKGWSSNGACFGPAAEGAVGWLADALVAGPETGDLPRVLLGDTYVAQDLPSALALAARLNGAPRPPIVTRAGERVDGLGAVTAGAPPAEAAVLQRQREIRELEAAAAPAAAERAPLAAALAAAQAEHTRLRGEEQLLEGELRRLAEQASREEGERRGLVQQRARQEHDLGWWNEYAGRTARQTEDLARRLRDLQARQAAAETASAAAAARADGQAAAWAAREREVAALRDQAAAARTAAAVAEQRASQAAQRAAAGAAAAAAARDDRAAAEGQRAQADDEVCRLDEAARAAAAALGEAERRLAGGEGEVVAMAGAAEATAAEVERWRTAAEQARARGADAERDLALLEARRAATTERYRALQDLAARELGDLPEARASDEPAEALAASVEQLQARLRALGPVNQVALQEHAEASERLAFLRGQLADLNAAATSIESGRAALEEALQADFARTFAAVAEHFRAYVRRLFGGGDGRLELTDPDNLAETGIEVVVQLPGKRRQELALLSGGERALVAAALLFALLRARPSPFCVLDEVDAALDEANVGRFCDALEELAAETQFVLITHNRATMERAGALYGVTLGADNVSRVVSLKLGDIASASGRGAPSHPN